jgi:transcriptional regulator with XRE-family HTH domain
MVQFTELTKAVREALESAPCSIRALADAAGVDYSHLSRVVGGERNISPEAAAKVAAALEAWRTVAQKAPSRSVVQPFWPRS